VRFALALIAVSLAIASPALASDRIPVVAVFEIKDSTARPKRMIANLTDYLRVKIAETGAMRVVDKGQQEAELRQLVQDQKKASYKECYDESCQIPLGKELAADKILRGSLSKVGKVFILSVELVDLASNTTSGASSAKSNGSEEQLLESIEKVVANLTKNHEPAKVLGVLGGGQPIEQKQPPPVVVAPPPPLPPAKEKRAFTRIHGGVQLVVREGGEVYALKSNENIERLKLDGSWELWDPGTGTRMITGDAGWLYVLKTDGKVWRRSPTTAWVKIDDGAGSKQVLAAAGRVFVLKDSGNVHQYGADNWRMIDNGTNTRQIAGDDRGNLLVLKDNGNIWRTADYGTNWYKIDDDTGTKMIAASEGVAYKLKDDGNVWRYNGTWLKIDPGTGTKMIAADRELLYVLKDSGQVWLNDGGSWQQLDRAPSSSFIAAAEGYLYAVANDPGSSLYESLIR
jgi:hypothetical protein